MLGKHALRNSRNKESLNKPFARLALVGLLGTLTTLSVGCSATRSLFSSSSSASGGESIILTDVDFDPDSLIPETQPVADYLGSKLGRAGISNGEVNIAPDVATVAEWMESGEVNLYFDSVYPAMLVMEESGAKPILRRWKDGVPEYGTFFVARADSGLSELDNLQGEMITLQEPSSSSGFMFPMVYMLEAGLNPVEKAEPNHTVAEDEVGYVFSGQEDITIEWILDGRVMAGAVDDETWSDLSEEEKSQLSIIAETEKFPRHMVLAGPKLTPKQLESLQAVMTGMDDNRAGREALKIFSETAQFDEFPDGAEAEIARLAGAYELLQSHLAAPEAVDLDEAPDQ